MVAVPDPFYSPPSLKYQSGIFVFGLAHGENEVFCSLNSVQALNQTLVLPPRSQPGIYVGGADIQCPALRPEDLYVATGCLL